MNCRAVAAYKPEPYRGRIVYVESEERKGSHAWAKLCREIEVVHVPGG
jgi:hypothetical protein